jgi:plastocyanin
MKKSMMFAFILMLSATLLISIAGCSSSKTAAPTTVTSTLGNSVNIVNFAFTPETLNVSVGTTVTWTNSDSATHHVASDTGVFDSGDMSQNATYSFTFNNAGTFPYHCAIHTYMKGTIIVK